MPQISDVAPETKTDAVVDATVVENTTPIPKTPKAKKEVKEKVEKPAKVEKKTEEKKVEYQRPAMELLTRDFEKHLTTLTVAGKPLVRLNYKCGKIIYGIKNTTGGKDFRVIAFKARKKHETVEGKSRCIYYFGTTKDMSKRFKEFPGIQNSKFSKCSVQSKHSIELVLDKVTFTDTFAQDIEKVMDTLKKLATVTIEQKEEQYAELQKKKEAKAD